MKFSWKIINHFIDLQNRNINEFENRLTLSGLEIEKIDNKVISLSITTNRKDILCGLNLAKEISSIFNIPLKILPITTNSKKYTNNKNINIVRILNLEKCCIEQTPKWLLSELAKHEIQDQGIIKNIQKYIKIKWGSTFDLINNNRTIKDANILSYIFNNEKNYKNIEKRFTNKSKIIIFKKEIFNINNNYFSSEFYENMYIDSIKLITTITQTKIGKYTQIEANFIKNNKIVKIKKSKINESLGLLNNKNYKFITTNNTIKILKQLHLFPQYNKLEKLFTVRIPKYREHDLYRDIDIIEEIGRIYKFEYFFTNINFYNFKGLQSQNYLQTKKIRNVLRSLGLHEIINSCLTNNIRKNKNTIQLYNPVNNEQHELRLNILENILHNYKDNIKHSKDNIEIFEISKIFKKEQNKYSEIRKLGGLIYNNQYIRNSWYDTYENINLFHFKNIIETFLKIINSTAIIRTIQIDKENNELKDLNHLFKQNNKMGIYDMNNKKFIGIIGELNTKIIDINIRNNNKVYIFEINIDHLIETIKINTHLNYIFKKYSNYPNVTRDISVKIKKFTPIEKIINIILNKNHSFIESITIINEYNNKKKLDLERYISLRIIYRSPNKTLTKKDLKLIDTNLNNTIKIIETFK